MLAPGLGVLNENDICSAETKLDLNRSLYMNLFLIISSFALKSSYDTASW